MAYFLFKVALPAIIYCHKLLCLCFHEANLSIAPFTLEIGSHTLAIKFEYPRLMVYLVFVKERCLKCKLKLKKYLQILLEVIHSGFRKSSFVYHKCKFIFGPEG